MSKTLIVGNSIEALSVAERLRQADAGCEIAFFATESFLPYDRRLLPELVGGSIKEVKMFPMALEFFKERNIEVLSNAKLARISVKRKYLTTEDKKQISYKHLVIIDTGEFILPDIKGHHKKGVYDALRLSSTKQLMKQLPYTDNVAVVVTNLQGLNMACALGALKKEVTVIVPTATLVPDLFDEETGSLLKQILETGGLRVIVDSKIDEILGDTDVKAIRLASGKVLACEMVVFDQAKVDLRMLSEETLPEGDQILEEPLLSALTLPMPAVVFGKPILDGFAVGATRLLEGGREYMKFDGPQNIYSKIYVKGDALVGAVLFNLPGKQGPLEQLIVNQASITGKEEQLLSV